MTTSNELIIRTKGVKVNFGDFWALMELILKLQEAR